MENFKHIQREIENSVMNPTHPSFCSNNYAIIRSQPILIGPISTAYPSSNSSKVNRRHNASPLLGLS